MPRTRVKICCIQTIAEAALAVRYGAAALGLVSAMPSGPGPIPEKQIAAIAGTIPPGVASFLLTCRQTAGEIIDQQRCCGTNTLQLCDAVAPEVHAELAAVLPGIARVQVVHVRGPEAVAEALEIALYVDALLLDSGNPTLAIKELGGTGRVHDWSLSREICRRAGVPVYLAGGLTPENVAEAIRVVEPFGVDVCSGVRTEDRLDEGKLRSFLQKAES